MAGRKSDYDVMVAGHLCLDIIPRMPDTGAREVAEILRPGKLVHVAEAQISTGGCVSNTGLALHLLGNRVCFSARIGNDAFGRLTLKCLERFGKATGIRVVEGAASPYSIVLAPPGIDRIILHYPSTNDAYGVEDLDAGLIARCRLFHFGYPTLMRRMYRNGGKELRSILKSARRTGATVSLDTTLPDPASPAGPAPWRRIMARALPEVDIFLPSLEEALYMLDPKAFLSLKKKHRNADLTHVLTPGEYARVADTLLSMGPPVVALKAGDQGWYLKTAPRLDVSRMGRARPGNSADWAGRELWCPALRVGTIASANGAGDASIAGFLTGFLKGLSPEMCLRAAVCLGWQNVQTLDAVSGIRSWTETLAILAANPPTVQVSGLSRAWKWMPHAQVWRGPSDGDRRGHHPVRTKLARRSRGARAPLGVSPRDKPPPRRSYKKNVW